MPLSADDFIEKSIDLRERKRYEESLISAQAAANTEPDNANAWWQVALSRWSMGDAKNALPALRRTVELVPRFGAGWARLGSAFLKNGATEEARDAFLTALEWAPEDLEALEAMALIYSEEDDQDQYEEEISVLERIEANSVLDSLQMNRLGILHYRKNHFHEAIKYWRDNAFVADHPASLFNLGLVYNHPQVSQDADAVDMWRLVLQRFPDYEPPKKSLTNVLPRMLKLAAAAKCQGETLLPRALWHAHYMNPFELLNPDEDLELDDFDPKTLQKLKKTLLQEIDLEDGKVSWLPDVTVDKSRAIGLCEELNNETKKEFHWHVYLNKPLLWFLTKGTHTHFLVDEFESPLETIELLEDGASGFGDWLGELFVPQFDRVLSKAIDARNLVVLECLLDGRRWVPSSLEDRCFENARRMVDRLVQPLRDANQRAVDEKPSADGVERILNAGALMDVLNLLPNYFEDFQSEVVQLIREIAINCFNSHDDIELSMRVINLAKLFHFRSVLINRQIEEDVEQIEELIKKERQHEAKLSSGSEMWEITKEGARLGASFISAANVSSARWGALITREQGGGSTYDFLVNIGAEDGRRINFAWKATKELERHEKHFQDLIGAALNYLFPSLMERVEKCLATGRALLIGPCKVMKDGIEFGVKGWIFTETRMVQWSRVRVSVDNGEMIVHDAQAPKTRVSFSLRDTDNAPLLRFLADIKNGRED